MYVDYSKLWKCLIDKDMTKTDLMELTGISSRVMAKLSKNQTVTTDTIARICAALHCDVGDIMACVEEEMLSVYGAYKKYGVCEAENECCQTIRFTLAGQGYTVYRSKQSATGATHIHCEEDRTVYWVQFHAVGHIANVPTRTVLVRPRREAGEVVIVLIKGKPATIRGLDENGFVSSRGELRSDEDVYVMSEAAFKLFAPKR